MRLPPDWTHAYGKGIRKAMTLSKRRREAIPVEITRLVRFSNACGDTWERMYLIMARMAVARWNRRVSHPERLGSINTKIQLRTACADDARTFARSARKR